MNKLFSLLCALPMLFFVSCQQGTLPTNGQVRRGPAPVDMVTCLRDVHPAYRSAFAGQNGANFDAQAQRSAYYAAMETARTPVPSSIASRSSRASKPATRVASKSRYAKSRTVASRSRSTASRSKSLASSRSKAARSKASSRKLAVNRSTSKRRR